MARRRRRAAGSQPTEKQTARKPADKFADLKSKIREASGPALHRILIFGSSRSGKTTLAATVGEVDSMSPALLLDFEGGSGSAAGLPNLDILSIESWADFNQIIEYLHTEDCKYKTVIVDSISEVHVDSLLMIIDDAVLKKSTRDANTPEIQDYGKAMIMIRRLLKALQSLPQHVILTALSKVDEYPREGKVRVPAMFGQLAGDLVGMFPIVGYLVYETLSKSKGIVKRERRLYLDGEGMRVGVRAPRSAQIPEFISEPTIEQIVNMITKAYGE